MQGPFNRVPRKRLMAEINVVPFIDIMLVLLVVFMITAPMLTQGVDVNLPQTRSEPVDPAQQEDPVIISVKRDGSYHLSLGEDTSEVDLAELDRRITIIRDRRPDAAVMVRGDREAAYGPIVSLMSTLQQAGVADVGLISEPPQDE